MARFFFFIFSITISLNNVNAQKGNTQLILNVGTTISLTQSDAYTPDIHVVDVFGYTINNDKNNANTAGLSYNTFKFKSAQSGVLNIGYQFSCYWRRYSGISSCAGVSVLLQTMSL